MASTNFQHKIIRSSLISLVVAIFCFSNNACTVKRSPVQPGSIPKLAAPSPGADEYGNELLFKLRADYDFDSDNRKYDKLVEVFDNLTKAAQVDHLPWHIFLFDGPEIVDIRAVYGNYIFVWSGLLDAVENDDELAGLLACELSHILAHHTDPVEFTIASDVLFNVAELATSLGLLVASHGVIAISGYGWMKWAYVEATDLDPLDRKYSEKIEIEAASVALLIISRTQYSAQGLLNFWKRVAEDESSHDKYERISRSLSPQQRSAMLETLIINPPKHADQLADMPTP